MPVKNSYGARFATREESLHGCRYGVLARMNWEQGGVVIASDENSIYVDPSESHVLNVGTTGKGKSTSVAMPSLLSMIGAGESAVVVDPVGEIYDFTAGFAREKGYKIFVLNLRDPDRSHCYNPLEVPRREFHAGNTDFAIELVNDLSDTAFPTKFLKEPYWDNSAANYMRSLALELIRCGKPEEVHMRSLVTMNTRGWKRFDSSIPKLFQGKEEEYSYFCASGTLIAPDNTRDCILSVFEQGMRIYVASDGLSRLLSRSDFDIADFGKEKCLLYVITADEKPTLHNLLAALISQWCQLLIREGGRHERNRLPVRVNMLLDEFANITIPTMTNLITVARKRNIRIFMMLQSAEQLISSFGEDNAKTIITNCGVRIYLNVSDERSRRQLSEECGMVRTVDTKGFVREEPLVPPYKFRQIYPGEALVFRDGVTFPFTTTLTPSFLMKTVVPPAPELPHNYADKIPVFNIVEYVESLKKASSTPTEPSVDAEAARRARIALEARKAERKRIEEERLAEEAKKAEKERKAKKAGKSGTSTKSDKPGSSGKSGTSTKSDKPGSSGKSGTSDKPDDSDTDK